MIPKNIFIFWDTEKLPDSVKLCIDSIKYHCPDYNINILNNNNYSRYISREEPPELVKYKIANKADWIRTVLIRDYGGIWIDASILLTQSLNNWINLNSEFVCIFNNNRIENWFFAAPKNSIIMNKWLEEYEYALHLGDKNYENKLYKVNNWTKNTYLFHQLCLLNALRLLNIDIKSDKFQTFNVGQLGFPKSIYNVINWETEFRINALMLNKKQNNIAPLYKLVSFTRSELNEIKHCNIEKGSPLDLSGYKHDKLITVHNDIKKQILLYYYIASDILQQCN